MSEEDTLLDAFVDVAARHLDKTENDIKEFIGRVRKSFGDVGVIDVKSSGKALIDPKAVSDAKAAIGSLRSELLKFSAEKNEVSIGVRLLGSKDITSQFQAIQSQVAAARDRFNDAEIGVAGNDVRAAELASIAASREHLAVLEQQIHAELKLKGLADVYATKALAIRNVTEQAQRFTLALQEVNSVVSKSKSPELKTDLLIASNAAKEIKQTLSSSLASGDLVGAEKAITELNEVQVRLKAIGAKASQQVNINTNVKDLVSQFNVAVQKAQSLNQLLQFESAGKLNIEQKIGLAKVEKEVRDIVNEFRNLSKATKITQADFKRLQILATNFSEASESMNALHRSTTTVSKSTNQLGNNAYQMGQAFEDAAVGFSLNGIQGAFRGAANNISFMVQNLSQAGALTGVLGASTAALLPLYLGIGTAALFVLPVLYKWWRSLDDVENKLKDISDLMNREFDSIEFMVSLAFDEQDRIKAIRDAEKVVDVIALVIKQAEDDKRLQATITATIDEFQFTRGLTGLDKNIDLIMEELERKSKVVFAFNFIEKSATATRAMAVFSEFNKQFDNLQEKSKEGLLDEKTISDAKNSAQNMKDTFQELIDTGVLAKEDFASAQSGIEIVNKALEKLERTQQKISSSKLDISDAGLATTERLTRELQFQQDINAGIATEEDRILFKMKEELRVAKELNDELLRKNGNTVENQKLAARNTVDTNLRHEIELLKRIHEIEKELAERQNKNNSARQSELGDRGVIVHGDLTKDKELQAIEDLTEELRKLREALEEAQDGRTQEEKVKAWADQIVGPLLNKPFDPDAFSRLLAEQKKAQERAAEEKRRQQKDIDDRITNETIGVPRKPDFVGPLDLTEAEKERQRRQREFDKPITNESIEADKRRKEAEFIGPIDQRTEEEKKIADVLDGLKAEREAKKVIADEEAASVDAQIKAEEEAAKIAEDAARAQADREEARFREDEAARQKERDWANEQAALQRKVDDLPEQQKRDEFTRQKLQESSDVIIKLFQGMADDAHKNIDRIQEALDRDKRLFDPATRDAELAAIFDESEEIKKDRDEREADHQKQREANERRRQAEESFDRTEREAVKAAAEKAIREDEQRQKEAREKFGVDGQGGPQVRVEPSFAPEDIPAQVNAQAQANARAMENTNFTSTTLQTLIATSNEILGKLNENVSKLDVSSRFT